ncbi:MAG: hypothetical protein AABN33_03965 [Acidobacteriota bacterium]
MRKYKLEDFIAALAYRLDTKYPEETVLEAELYASVQALFTSLRWTALRLAKKLLDGGLLGEGVSKLETTDHFASEWMSREEIVYRIMDTTGFNEEMSAYSLSAIEEIVDSALSEEAIVRGATVTIVGIGDIQSLGYPRYRINLVATLSVVPRSKQSISASG